MSIWMCIGIYAVVSGEPFGAGAFYCCAAPQQEQRA